MIRVSPDAETKMLRIENAFLRGKIEAYENFLGMKGFLKRKECEDFVEGLEDA